MVLAQSGLLGPAAPRIDHHLAVDAEIVGRRATPIKCCQVKPPATVGPVLICVTLALVTVNDPGKSGQATRRANNCTPDEILQIVAVVRIAEIPTIEWSSVNDGIFANKGTCSMMVRVAARKRDSSGFLSPCLVAVK